MRTLQTVVITLWAWGLCVGGFWIASGNARLTSVGGTFETMIGVACICAGLHVFAMHGARDAFPSAAGWIRRGVQAGSLGVAVVAIVVGVVSVM